MKEMGQPNLRLRGMESMASIPTSERTEHRPPGFLVAFADWIADWGRVTIDSIVDVGRFTLFVFETLRWLLTRLPKT